MLIYILLKGLDLKHLTGGPTAASAALVAGRAVEDGASAVGEGRRREIAWK